MPNSPPKAFKLLGGFNLHYLDTQILYIIGLGHKTLTICIAIDM